ncbi:FadR/GntR family transcriptional regulator [Peterkaempfera bronchialis]|uniref:FadR family transcriptional regulator n=1 Tax=Peterkaempfera bronchialis TaxID=2126346 RepID=A0A345SR84_9ACTN|nr:FadR/GntR family transcriptional regulator [Peterkaempfera bronchialis]AXI76239.1 FadR family transcriptional regulator [Peterkaempfera bronchialis]
MTVRPIHHSSLVEQAVAELRRLIGEGEWPVGTKLPGEVELSRQLGVGRSTSREAVRALIADGQLRAQHGSGTYVSSTTPVSELDRRLLRAAVSDVYEVRVALEVEAGRLAAARRTPDDIEALRAALGARDRAADRAELVEADVALHRCVVTAAHNPVLSHLFDTFQGALRQAATQLLADAELHPPEHGRRIDDAHRDLVQAIVAGDPDAAVAATRRNLDRTLDHLRADPAP